MELDDDIETIARGSIWHGLNTLIFKFLSFLYTIIIARMVLQEEVGVFYFALGLVGLVGIFSDAGFTQAIARYVPYYLGKKDTKSASLAIRVSWDISVILGLILAAALFLLAESFAAFFSNLPLAGVLRILAIYVFVYQIFNIIASWLIAFKKVREASNGANLQNAVKLLLTLGFILYAAWADAQALAIATILSFVVSTAYLYLKARKETARLPALQEEAGRRTGYWKMMREMGGFGMTMIFVLLMATLVTYTDRLLLGYFLKGGANAQIAIYSIATGLASLVGLFAASIMAIFYPVISEIHGRGDEKKRNAACGTAIRWILFSSLPIAAFLIAFSSPMLHLLYGAAYEPGALVLSLFSIGIFASLLGTAQRTALAGMRRLDVERNVAIVTFVGNAILNALFIPIWGINGAALASMLALLGMAVLNQYYANRIMKFSFPPSAWKNLAAGAAALAVLAALESFAYRTIVSLPIPADSGTIASLVIAKAITLAALAVFAAIGAALYLVLINIMRLFEQEDAEVFRRIAAKTGMPSGLQKLAARIIFWNQHEIR